MTMCGWAPRLKRKLNKLCNYYYYNYYPFIITVTALLSCPLSFQSLNYSIIYARTRQTLIMLVHNYLIMLLQTCCSLCENNSIFKILCICAKVMSTTSFHYCFHCSQHYRYFVFHFHYHLNAALHQHVVRLCLFRHLHLAVVDEEELLELCCNKAYTQNTWL